MNTNTAPPSVLFDADEYSRESGDFSDAADWESVTTTSQMPEAHPRYVPPHKRPVNLQMGDHTQVNVGDKPDEQGVLNRSFQKLLIYVHFALTKLMVEKLARRFPGCFFHSDSHGNHDHPIAHVVTQVGTRFLQRMIPAGVNVLDVYGSPFSCEGFNASQRKAKNPKVMYPLVANACSADFIREVNKWGPRFDAVGARYATGHIRRQDDAFLDGFDVFQAIHTLYYMTLSDITHLLHAGRRLATTKRRGGSRKMLALIHSHSGKHGFLNEGEQEYWINGRIVKQRNVATNTTYCHPNITPFWFRENKEYYADNGQGFAWECHLVCEDTWIVEIVGCLKADKDDDFLNNWEQEFELAAAAEVDLFPKAKGNPVKPVTMLPSDDGKFVELDVCSMELFEHLRLRCMGKDRHGKAGEKLFLDLFDTARNLVFPSALFPDKKPVECPAHLIRDHVISAFVTDLEGEFVGMAALKSLQGLVYKHSRTLTGKRAPPTIGTADMYDLLRAGTKAGIRVTKVIRSKDPLLATLEHADRFLEDGY